MGERSRGGSKYVEVVNGSENKQMELTLFTASSQHITLPNARLNLVLDADRVCACKLIFKVSPELYHRLADEAIFNDHPSLRIPISNQDISSNFEVTVETSLNPNLVSNLVDHAATNESALVYLLNLGKTQADHILLSTESWFTLSVVQYQDAQQVGYRTLWFSLRLEWLVEEAIDNDKIADSLVEFFQELMESSLLQPFEQLDTKIKEVISEYKSEFCSLDFPDNNNLQIQRKLNHIFNSLESSSDTNTSTDAIEDFFENVGNIFEALAQELQEEAVVTKDRVTEGQILNSVTKLSSTCFLEEGERLSQSCLWQLQRNYFEKRGVSSYCQNTLSSNYPSIAALALYYTHSIAAFLQDCTTVTKRHKTDFAILDKTQPIYILEVGAGSGHFAYRFLQYLQSRLMHPSLKKLNVTYVLTDFVPQTLEFWQQHLALQPFFKQGSLDVAYFDLQNPDAIALRRSGETLTPYTLANPLIVIANNVFSCLPQDAYYIESGTLYEDLVSLSAPEGTDLDHWEALSQLSIHYDQQPIAPERTDIPNTLQRYCQTCDRSHILWPTIALQSLDYLLNLAGDHLMVLSSDMAYCHEIALQDNSEPTPTINGYITLPVNYHALADYAQHNSGQALQPEHSTPGFSTQVLLFGKHPTGFWETQAVYHNQDILSGELSETLLAPLVAEQLEALSLPQLLGYLRSRHWDSEVFLTCFSVLLPQLETVTPALRHDAIQGIQKIWQGYYPIGEDSDLAFFLGMALYTLGNYTSAIEYFERSCQSHGDDPNTLYNLAMSHYRLGQTQQVIVCLEKTLELDPNFEAAHTLRQELVG